MHRLLSLYVAAPQPAAAAPPGSGGFTTVLAWIAWIAALAFTGALVVVGIKLAFAGRTHSAGEHGMSFLLILTGAIISATAGAILSQVAGI